MNAMQKVAWTHLVVSVVAVAAVTLLFPFIGSRATGAFALLGLVGLGGLFLRRHGSSVIVDERDREIERRATSIAVGTAWMVLTVVLAVATVWSSYTNLHTVSTGFLNWLIWVNFALCVGMKGLAAVVLYRRQQHAA
jgi:cytochrome bd-type quinol oxidase subunit 2